ncbi:hypothetical protein Hanom_Chr05g00399971 [Helianthus anomalus]
MAFQPVYIIPEGGSSPILQSRCLMLYLKIQLHAPSSSFIFLSPLSDSYRNVDSVHTSS